MAAINHRLEQEPFVGYFRNYQSIFGHKRAANLEKVYTRFNFFAWIYWKGMKLGEYDKHTYKNRSVAPRQYFLNIRLVRTS